MNEEMRWNDRYATNIPISYVSCTLWRYWLEGSRCPQEWLRRILAWRKRLGDTHPMPNFQYPGFDRQL
jgi:hypothetical protein